MKTFRLKRKLNLGKLPPLSKPAQEMVVNQHNEELRDVVVAGGQVAWRPANGPDMTLTARCVFGGGTIGIDQGYNGQLYRYDLQYVFDDTKPLLVVMMLNPSTASHMELDPTVRRLLTRAYRSGNFGGVRIVNVYAFRSANPEELRYAADPVGEYNNEFIEEAAEYADRTAGWMLVGWGNYDVRSRQDAIDILMDSDVACRCLNYNANGSPAHPLYQPDNAVFKIWPKPSETTVPDDDEGIWGDDYDDVY